MDWNRPPESATASSERTPPIRWTAARHWLAAWLAPRGLAFNEDKTRIVHVEQNGFDFLGFKVRRYDGKLLIKPSPAALRRIRERLRTEMKALRGANVSAVLHAIDPIVRGWSAYYRTVVSSHFGRFNKSRQDRWVFGDRDTNSHLRKVLAVNDIESHVDGASPVLGDRGSGGGIEQAVDHLLRRGHAVVIAEAQGQVDGSQ